MRVLDGGGFSVPKRLLSVLLSAGIVWSGVPAVQADQSDAIVSYVENEGELFRLDFSDFANVQLEDVSSGPASWQVTLDHAVFPGGMSRPEYFVFGDPAETSQFIDRGIDPAAAAKAVGEDISTVIWEQIAQLDVTSTRTRFVLRYTVQEDYLELSYPKSFMGLGVPEDPSDVVSIEINGAVATLSKQLLYKLGSGDPDTIEPMLGLFPASVTSTVEALVDPDGLMNVLVGFEYMALVTKLDNPLVPQSCFGVCLVCAGSLGVSLLGLASMVIACGGTLITGGATALLCIMAFVGTGFAAIIAIGSCVQCNECGRDDGGCPCAGMPVCNCG